MEMIIVFLVKIINILDDYNNTCVDNCTENGREYSDKDFECKPLRKNSGTNTDGYKGNDETDYLLWIFIAVTGVLLIIITICICKKCCGSNKNDDIIEDSQKELTDKTENETNGEFGEIN